MSFPEILAHDKAEDQGCSLVTLRPGLNQQSLERKEHAVPCNIFQERMIPCNSVICMSDFSPLLEVKFLKLLASTLELLSAGLNVLE